MSALSKLALKTDLWEKVPEEFITAINQLTLPLGHKEGVIRIQLWRAVTDSKVDELVELWTAAYEDALAKHSQIGKKAAGIETSAEDTR